MKQAWGVGREAARSEPNASRLTPNASVLVRGQAAEILSGPNDADCYRVRRGDGGVLIVHRKLVTPAPEIAAAEAKARGRPRRRQS